MMGKAQRSKGQRGEREWAAYLTEIGFPATRGVQYHGGEDSPDIRGGIPGTHAEVKRVERLNVHDAMKQAESDCGDRIPYVAHRRNREPWMVTLRATDIEAFAFRVAIGLGIGEKEVKDED